MHGAIPVEGSLISAPEPTLATALRPPWLLPPRFVSDTCPLRPLARRPLWAEHSLGPLLATWGWCPAGSLGRAQLPPHPAPESSARTSSELSVWEGSFLFQARGAFPSPPPWGAGVLPKSLQAASGSRKAATHPRPHPHWEMGLYPGRDQASQKRRRVQAVGLPPQALICPSLLWRPLGHLPGARGSGTRPTPACRACNAKGGPQPGGVRARERESTPPGTLEGFQEEALCEQGLRQAGTSEKEDSNIPPADPLSRPSVPARSQV